MKKKTLFLMLLLAALGLPASSVAQSTLVVPAFAFRGEAEGTFAYAYNSTDGYVWAGQQASSPGCMVAPVVLEDGAEITGLSADLYDNLGTNLGLQLLRHTLLATTPDAELIAEVATTGAGTGIVRQTAASITHGTVDNDSFAYYLSTAGSCLAADDAGHRIYGARISFVASLVFSDGFESGDLSRWGGTGSTSFHKITIPAAGFFPEQVRGVSTQLYVIDSVGGYYESYNVVSSSCHIAPVSLPDGAVLTWMRSFLLDNHPSANLTVELRRKAFKTTATATVISSVATIDASPAVVSDFAGVSQPTIDNDTYTYYLSACFVGSSQLRIYGITLGYVS